MLELFHYEIPFIGKNAIHVWGNGKKVFAGTLDSKGSKEIPDCIAKPEIKIIEGKKSDPIFISFENYVRAKKFEPKLETVILKGTLFQKVVWRELLKIPLGKTVTYSELAERIGKPLACRAVGNAVGKNPIGVLIPCHRVVAKNGLGGFTGGIEFKKMLLRHEGIEVG